MEREGCRCRARARGGDGTTWGGLGRAYGGLAMFRVERPRLERAVFRSWRCGIALLARADLLSGAGVWRLGAARWARIISRVILFIAI